MLACSPLPRAYGQGCCEALAPSSRVSFRSRTHLPVTHVVSLPSSIPATPPHTWEGCTVWLADPSEVAPILRDTELWLTTVALSNDVRRWGS